MASVLKDYFDALERLKKNSPVIIPKGSKISNDTVALEAGRGRGSIKKSRELFTDLITEIENASKTNSSKSQSVSDIHNKTKEDRARYKLLYEESLGRELSMLHEIDQLKSEIKDLKRSTIKRVR